MLYIQAIVNIQSISILCDVCIYRLILLKPQGHRRDAGSVEQTKSCNAALGCHSSHVCVNVFPLISNKPGSFLNFDTVVLIFFVLIHVSIPSVMYAAAVGIFCGIIVIKILVEFLIAQNQHLCLLHLQLQNKELKLCPWYNGKEHSLVWTLYRKCNTVRKKFLD